MLRGLRSIVKTRIQTPPPVVTIGHSRATDASYHEKIPPRRPWFDPPPILSVFKTIESQTRTPTVVLARTISTYHWNSQGDCEAGGRDRWHLGKAPGDNAAPDDNLGFWSNFGFDIPAPATIVGLEVRVFAKATQYVYGPIQGDCGDSTMYTITAPATGLVKLQRPGFPFPHGIPKSIVAADGTFVYGGEDDMWGGTWAPASLNDPGLGWCQR